MKDCWLILWWFSLLLSGASVASLPESSKVGQRNRVTLATTSRKNGGGRRRRNKIKHKLNQQIQQQQHQQRKGRQANETLSLKSPPVSVSAILVPRQFNIQAVIRFTCVVSMICSLLLCFKTAGLPHIKSVWEILYGNEISSDPSGKLKNQMPSDYIPSAADLHVAQIIARSTRYMLPPIGLPSAPSMVLLLLSIFFYVGLTILLPRWFLPIRIFMDYQRFKPTTMNHDSLSSSTDRTTTKRVLININNPKMRSDLASENFGGQRNIICDVLESPSSSAGTSAKSKKRKCTTTSSNGNHTDTTTLLSSQYTHPYSNFFEVNQCRFYLDLSTGSCVDGGPTMVEGGGISLKEVRSLVKKGLTKNDRQVAIERFQPYNRPKLASPTIREAFVARISSPLVVVQILGQLLSLLENGPRSLMNTFTTFARHYNHARQAISSARQMNQDIQSGALEASNIKVRVLKSKISKNKKGKRYWKAVTAEELIPGDIFVLPPPQDGSNVASQHEELEIPVDALVLDGQGLTNEAVLTGESVPQSKTPIDFDEELNIGCCFLDINENHRGSILFAGTKVIYTSSDIGTAKLQSYNIPPHKVTGGLTCVALRTGTYSSKGKILRSLKSSTNIGAISNDQSDKDALRLILSLSIFAAMSCVSLFVGGGSHHNQQQKPVPAFRRVIQCTRIAIASIPSDLPLSLSHVTKSCSRKLRDESDVVCSEPGALLTAAYIDTVVFDKTGTLTADTQSLSKLVSKIGATPTIETSPDFQNFLLAGCHSLVQMRTTRNNRNYEFKIVGDPLDLSAVRFSKWKFNNTIGGYYYNPEAINTTVNNSDPIRLWQIRTFPFDPKKRLSSALVLAESLNGDHRLWILTKGSPGTMAHLYDESQKGASHFIPSFENRTRDLEAQGYRCIALGATEVSMGSPLIATLFPDGLSCVDCDLIEYARSQGAALHRSDFEHLKPSNNTDAYVVLDATAGLEFHGFACFDAKVRPSSKRVIEELNRGGLFPVMLTGDAIDSALSVASKVGIVKVRKVAILETCNASNGTPPLLQWRFVALKDGKALPTTSVENEHVNIDSVKDIVRRQKRGKLAIAATGEALEFILEGSHANSKVFKFLADNLFRFSVLARATPSLKTSVVTCLKDRCQKKVMMCGDGVNDVSAMKVADVSVALLNGFGAEGETKVEKDLDDKRREERINSKKIGSNRRKFGGSDTSRQKNSDRVQKKIDKANAEIRRKAAARQGKVSDQDVTIEFQDIKEMLSETMRIVNNERKRNMALKKGGGEAARILAEDRHVRSSSATGGDVDNKVETESIRPGEASLVAPFSCLHPSIDGVDAVLRSGVATAACALATQKDIALHALMACYHLATLYRDGFRYGKNMWPVELYMYILVDTSRYGAACTARPRLPSSQSASLRPSISLFHPASLVSTVVQAIIHLVIMSIGVDYARDLEALAAESKHTSRIQVAGRNYPGKLGKFINALVVGVGAGEEGEVGFFRRRFQPNYETNIVFLLSILQSCISSLVNHQGKPFYLSILETRGVCFSSGLTLLFVVACVMETFPRLNIFLEMRRLPGSKSKLTFLGIIIANMVGCVSCRILSDFLLRKNWKEASLPPKSCTTAADLEEELLKEEERLNSRTLLAFLVAAFWLLLEGLVANAERTP